MGSGRALRGAPRWRTRNQNRDPIGKIAHRPHRARAPTHRRETCERCACARFPFLGRGLRSHPVRRGAVHRVEGNDGLRDGPEPHPHSAPDPPAARAQTSTDAHRIAHLLTWRLRALHAKRMSHVCPRPHSLASFSCVERCNERREECASGSQSSEEAQHRSDACDQRITPVPSQGRRTTACDRLAAPSRQARTRARLGTPARRQQGGR